MKKYLYFALAVLYACSPALAQNDYPTETDLYVFWQPDRPLTPADFQKRQTKAYQRRSRPLLRRMLRAMDASGRAQRKMDKKAH